VENLAGTLEFACEILRLVDADLKLAPQPCIAGGEGERRGPAGRGHEALELGEGLRLFLRELADVAGGTALIRTAFFDEVDLLFEDGVGLRVFRGRQPFEDGCAGRAVAQGSEEPLRIAKQRADGEGEVSECGHVF